MSRTACVCAHLHADIDPASLRLMHPDAAGRHHRVARINPKIGINKAMKIYVLELYCTNQQVLKISLFVVGTNSSTPNCGAASTERTMLRITAFVACVASATAFGLAPMTARCFAQPTPVALHTMPRDLRARPEHGTLLALAHYALRLSIYAACMRKGRARALVQRDLLRSKRELQRDLSKLYA